jgi:hypothetical protein
MKSTTEFSSIIDSKFDNDTAIAIKDLFASGCFIHSLGHHEGGRKLCHAAMYAVGFTGNKDYFSNLLNTIDGNEKEYALGVLPHNEIRELFES